MLIQELWQYFYHKLGQNVRFNIAGGEPTLLGNKLLEILNNAKEIGFSTSIITNASKLNDLDFATALYRKIDILGISIDAINPNHNIAIGRQEKNKKHRPLNINDFISYINLAKAINPKIIIKINTVVNEINKNEDLSPLIEAIQPDKWKILQMLPRVTDFLSIMDSDFNKFVARHQKFQEISVIEDNNAMCNSYIMIDPKGRFYQSNSAKTIQYSEPITKIGCEEAFKQISFCEEKFEARYPEILREANHV